MRLNGTPTSCLINPKMHKAAKERLVLTISRGGIIAADLDYLLPYTCLCCMDNLSLLVQGGGSVGRDPQKSKERWHSYKTSVGKESCLESEILIQ